jgi:hypothetical protein
MEKVMDITQKLAILIESDLSSDDKETAKRKIMGFLKDNPAPPDKDIHKLGTELDVDIDLFEGLIYEILGSFAGHGYAKERSFTEEDADPEELSMGIKVEREHTNWPFMAKRIALDHLSEIKDYYTRLKKMEAGADSKVDGED